MLQSHPSAEDIHEFLRCCTRAADQSVARKRLIRHLLASCPTCHQKILDLGWTQERLERLLELSPGADRPVLDQASDLYRKAFQKVENSVDALLRVRPCLMDSVEDLLAQLEGQSLEEQRRTVSQDTRFAHPLLAERLIKDSHAARYDNTDAMLERAELARVVADSCSSKEVGNELLVADLRAWAWGHLGNTLRVRGQLREAEKALLTAEGLKKQGTGDPRLSAKLLEQMASLHIFERRFARALELSDAAAQIYRELGETHSLSSTLVQKAIASLYGGEPENAVTFLNQAIPLIDQEKDPYLLLASCHNLILSYIDLERPDQALALYFEIQDLYGEFGDSLILLRTAWQQGRLLRDLGHLRAAEGALRRARTGFSGRGLAYEVAVVSLDLSSIYVQLGDTDNLRQTIAETVPIFQSLRVGRETLACLVQLRHLADQEHRALELIKLIANQLEAQQKSSKAT